MGILLITVFIFAAMIVSFSLSQVYAEPVIYDDDYAFEKFSTGLQYPTTMYFVGDDILVLEKSTGKVIRVSDNGIHYNEPVLDVPVDACWESGFLGISGVSNYIFLYFSESESGFDTVECHDQPIKNKVYRYDWNGEKLTNPILIKEVPGNLDGLHRHNGGAMTTDQNNEIYFVVGDSSRSATYQNIPNKPIYETGIVFKIDAESNSVELYAMGIRNSFGLAVDPITGYLWDTENGIYAYDEINLVKPGFNSGWKRVMGPVDRYNPDIDRESTLTQTIPPPFENFVYSDPEFSFEHTSAVTAIEFPDKHSFEKYSDWLFVGDYNNGRIYKFQLNSDRTEFVFSNPGLSDLVLDDNDEMDEILFAEGFHGVTDIEFHDGSMYVSVIGDGSIYKIYPKEHLSPLKQYQNGVTHKNIVCNEELMPVMSKSGSIYCVYPKSATTLVNVLNWSIEHPDMPKIELKNQDLHGLNFEHLNLSDSDFRGADFDDAKISDVNFSNADLSHTDLSGKDLTGTILTGADLSGTNLTNVNLSGKDLTGTILSGADLTGTILTGADLTKASLTNITWLDNLGAELSGTDFWAGKLKNSVNLSGKDLTGTILTGADLTGAIFTGINLSDKDLTGTILTGADLTDTILPDVGLSGKEFKKTRFDGVDLSGKDLSASDFQYASFKNANLQNTNLNAASFVQVDLTEIKNKSLVGADLSHASFAHSDLSGVNLSGVRITMNNFDKADLSGLDFTVIFGPSLNGSEFIEANLSNSNFEGVNLGPEIEFFDVFKNKAFLMRKFSSHGTIPNSDLVENLFGKEYINTRLILFTEVRGNDLAVKWIDLNNFDRANLENVNFKNAILWHATFHSANLTNADLSGADLKGTDFGKADLSNANLSGADLTEANLSGADLSDADLSGADLFGADLTEALVNEGTILACKNHPICLTWNFSLPNYQDLDQVP